MEGSFEEATKCVWHAFNTLDDQMNGTVSRSKLKVLTHNLANAVGIEGLEERLQDETVILDFNDYQEFIEKQLFDALKKRSDDVEFLLYGKPISVESICDVCWVLCAKRFSSRAAKVLDDSDSMKMWKVFNYLVEPGTAECSLSVPLRIDVDEVQFILKRFADCTGGTYRPEKLDADVGETKTLDFLTFMQAFETVALANLKPSEISQGVNGVYEEITQDVIKKGMVAKKGHMVTNWKDRWIVLTPMSLKYYANRWAAARDMKGEIPITHQSTVESHDEKTLAKLHRFTLYSISKKPYEFGVADLKTKNEWIRALQLAIEYSSKPGQVQKVAAAERRHLRDEQRSQVSEEERKRREEQDMILQQRSELESERLARAQLEARYAEEAERRETFLQKLKEIERLREEEQRRLAELEEKYQKEVADRKSNLKNLRELQDKYEEETAAREAHMKKVQELEEMCQAEERKLQDLESKYHDETSQREADLTRLQELEGKYQEEAALREVDQQKLRELEEVRKELENLLDEERTARKDEEVVRCLQGRLLEEEEAKREELERLARQQMALRVVEQQQREGLEEEYREKEEALEAARRQLEQLELDRKAADEKLSEATAKLEEAQAERAKAQEKARLWSTPIGLARPIQPEPKPWITHRGEGAFVEADFHRFERSEGKKAAIGDELNTSNSMRESLTTTPENANAAPLPRDIGDEVTLRNPHSGDRKEIQDNVTLTYTDSNSEDSDQVKLRAKEVASIETEPRISDENQT